MAWASHKSSNALQTEQANAFGVNMTCFAVSFDDDFSQSDIDFSVDTQDAWDVDSISMFCQSKGVDPTSYIPCAVAHEAMMGR